MFTVYPPLIFHSPADQEELNAGDQGHNDCDSYRDGSAITHTERDPGLLIQINNDGIRGPPWPAHVRDNVGLAEDLKMRDHASHGHKQDGGTQQRKRDEGKNLPAAGAIDPGRLHVKM